MPCVGSLLLLLAQLAAAGAQPQATLQPPPERVTPGPPGSRRLEPVPEGLGPPGTTVRHKGAAAPVE